MSSVCTSLLMKFDDFFVFVLGKNMWVMGDKSVSTVVVVVCFFVFFFFWGGGGGEFLLHMTNHPKLCNDHVNLSYSYCK